MTKKEIILFIALGITFWFSAALTVRLVGDAVFTQSNQFLIVAFILALPITFGFLFITKIISGISFPKLLKPIALMTGTAAMLDGVALTWFTGLYSSSFEVALFGAAWILWGAGLGLIIGFYYDFRHNKN